MKIVKKSAYKGVCLEDLDIRSKTYGTRNSYILYDEDINLIPGYRKVSKTGYRHLLSRPRR